MFVLSIILLLGASTVAANPAPVTTDGIVLKAGAEYHELPTPASHHSRRTPLDLIEETGHYVMRPVRFAKNGGEPMHESAELFWGSKHKKPKQGLHPIEVAASQDEVGKAADANVLKLRKTIEKMKKIQEEHEYYDPHHIKDQPKNLAENIKALEVQYKQGLFGKRRLKLYTHNAVQRALAQGFIEDGHPVQIQNRIHHSKKIGMVEAVALASKGQAYKMKLLKDKKVRGKVRRIKVTRPSPESKMPAQEEQSDPSMKTTYWKAGPIVYRLPSQRFVRKTRTARLAHPLRSFDVA